MGRFHRHDDGTVHTHDHDHDGHVHDHAHGDHSGYQTGTERIEVLESIFAENDIRADINRGLFAEHGVRALNLMSSPGSGKTTLLARTLDDLGADVSVGIVEGDIETDLDAAKLGGRGAQISLLNTANGFGGECHLDAPMVNRALQGLDLTRLDLVIIENVGNLVCPAEFDVGEHAKVMVYSVTEGEDKPLKYPVMFRAVDVVLLNKIDLVAHLDADVRTYTSRVRRSIRPPRSFRSARARARAWRPGTTGCAGSSRRGVSADHVSASPGSTQARARTDAAAAATITAAQSFWVAVSPTIPISALSGSVRCAMSQSYSSQSSALATSSGSACGADAAAITARMRSRCSRRAASLFTPELSNNSIDRVSGSLDPVSVRTTHLPPFHGLSGSA